MKTVLASLVLVSSSMAFARSLTCAQASAAVQANGAAIIHTGPHLYDRYVSNESYCGRDQYAKPAWIRTSDSEACFVGYTCADRNNSSED